MLCAYDLSITSVVFKIEVYIEDWLVILICIPIRNPSHATWLLISFDIHFLMNPVHLVDFISALICNISFNYSLIYSSVVFGLECSSLLQSNGNALKCLLLNFQRCSSIAASAFIGCTFCWFHDASVREVLLVICMILLLMPTRVLLFLGVFYRECVGTVIMYTTYRW